MTETRAGPDTEAFTLVYRSQRDRLRRVAYLMTGQAAVGRRAGPRRLRPAAPAVGHGRRPRGLPAHHRRPPLPRLALTSLAAGAPAASPYQGALDRLVGLADVRHAFDAYTGPRDLGAIDTANDLYGRYAELVGGLLDAQDEVALAIDDPQLRTGVQVYTSGVRLLEQTAQLVRAAMVTVVEPGSSSVTELGRLYGLVRDGHEALRSLAAGTPYEDAVTTVLGEIADSDLLDLVAAALEGPTDIAATLGATGLAPDQGWPAFLDRVEALLFEQG